MGNLYDNHEPMKLKCYSCDEEGHIAKLCPKLHICLDKFSIINDVIMQEEEERRQFKRKPKKHFNFRVDKELIFSCTKQIQKYYNMG